MKSCSAFSPLLGLIFDNFNAAGIGELWKGPARRLSHFDCPRPHGESR
jgi:hypothetical protein